jgi:hypothetical protein
MQMVINWSDVIKRSVSIKIIGYLLIPVALYLIPLNWIEHQHSICLIKNLTGHECPGCGMTRAVLSAMHLQFANAWHYNKLVIVVLPLLVYVWGRKCFKS